MGATDKQSGLVQGTLDMLILKTLALEPMHGYGIGVRIEQISKGVFSGQRRVALSRVPPPGARRPHQRRVARDREQPARESTRSPRRARASSNGDARLGSADGRHRAHPQGVHWRGVMTWLKRLAGGFATFCRVPWREIIGVVGDIRDDGVHRKPSSAVYWPMLVSQFLANRHTPAETWCLRFAPSESTMRAC